MSENKAIPTEYKGIRFRSKSEACFAKYLDHHQSTWRPLPFFWEYEPQSLTLEDGYTPDFRTIYCGAGHIYCSLIEYKPTLPTETYAFSVLEKLAILANSVAMDCLPRIQCGSFWDNSDAARPKTLMLVAGEVKCRDGWERRDSDEWPLRQQIAQTRFDLASELSQWKGHLHG